MKQCREKESQEIKSGTGGDSGRTVVECFGHTGGYGGGSDLV